MATSAILLLVMQILVLLVFSFFSFYHYLYGIASLWKPRLPRIPHSGEKVAVVIVAFNERFVIENTLNACDQLTYPNKLIILADDSTDPEAVEHVRQLAISRGCQRVMEHGFRQDIPHPDGSLKEEPIEIWESESFVLFHRPKNVGFKAGSLKKVHDYLHSRGIAYMYLLDADWQPQPDALERTLEVLEADKSVAFVQTKRITSPQGMSVFQKYVALIEEGCYYVDFEGRQVLGHPMLFSGCCTLFRMDAVAEVGGFTPGHLTEDLDLTDRFWINGWNGLYLGEVVNLGEVPFGYNDFRKQQERWSAGTARALREYFWPLLKTDKLSWSAKLSAIRQNGYYSTTLLSGFAIILGMSTVGWLVLKWNTYGVESYLFLLGHFKWLFAFLIIFCILSKAIEPILMIVVKRRSFHDLLHLPMMVWYAWSVILTYIIGNIKGLFGFQLGWFRTPKFLRNEVGQISGVPRSVRLMNLGICTAVVGFYFSQGWVFGWFDIFCLLIVPAFILASLK